MIENNIIEKVKKLLAFQKGAEKIGSLQEAANAAEKVQAILLKYNLEISDVSSHVSKEENPIGKVSLTGVTSKKNEGDWIYMLYTILAEHNFCRVILTKTLLTHKRVKYVNLIGTKDNIIVVKFLAEQLENRLRVLEKIAWQNNTYRITNKFAFKRAYFQGACAGINAKLKRAKEMAKRGNNSINSLVLVTDKKLDEAIDKIFYNGVNPGRVKNKIPVSELGVSLGFKDGVGININKGVETSKEQNKYLQ